MMLLKLDGACSPIMKTKHSKGHLPCKLTAPQDGTTQFPEKIPSKILKHLNPFYEGHSGGKRTMAVSQPKIIKIGLFKGLK